MQAHSHITISIVLIVIGAGALHAIWNAVTGLPARASIWFAVLSATIHIGYDLGLMNSYRLGSFNQVYPIARGTSPLVVALGAYFLVSEHLGVIPLAGVAILAAGLASLALSSGRITRSELPAVCVAVLTGLTIAGYTIVDGLGVRHSHDPYAYAGLLFFLMGPVFVVVAAFRRPGFSWLTGPTAAKGLLAGTLSLVAYGTVLWAQTRAPLAEVAAIAAGIVLISA